jgi:hypothetical protein
LGVRLIETCLGLLGILISLRHRDLASFTQRPDVDVVDDGRYLKDAVDELRDASIWSDVVGHGLDLDVHRRALGILGVLVPADERQPRPASLPTAWCVP